MVGIHWVNGGTCGSVHVPARPIFFGRFEVKKKLQLTWPGLRTNDLVICDIFLCDPTSQGDHWVWTVVDCGTLEIVMHVIVDTIKVRLGYICSVKQKILCWTEILHTKERMTTYVCVLRYRCSMYV